MTNDTEAASVVSKKRPLESKLRLCFRPFNFVCLSNFTHFFSSYPIYWRNCNLNVFSRHRFALKEVLISDFPDGVNTKSQLPIKRPKRETTILNQGQKNPVSILNELKSGIKYITVEQSGPPHAPIFKVSVEIESQVYIGTGGSKKLAKYKAAELALQSFIQFPNNIKTVSPTLSNSGDFTSDTYNTNGTNGTSESMPTTKSAVMLLNELYPNTKYECTENGDDIYARFKVVAIVGKDSFIGTGMYSYLI